MYNRRPLLLIIKEIEKRIKEKDFSVRSLEWELNERGFKNINRGKIYRTFYTKDDAQYFLNSADDTIEAVLTVLGITSEDLMQSIISKEEETYPDEIKEIMEFVHKPESMPYLKLAYAQYKVNIAEENVKRLEQAILNQSPK